MADLIDRQEAIDAFRKEYGGIKNANMDGDFLADEIEFVLYKLPSAQPDIIVCADCKHWICHDRRCGYWNQSVKPLDWCCHAERKTDG